MFFAVTAGNAQGAGTSTSRQSYLILHRWVNPVPIAPNMIPHGRDWCNSPLWIPTTTRKALHFMYTMRNYFEANRFLPEQFLHKIVVPESLPANFDGDMTIGFDRPVPGWQGRWEYLTSNHPDSDEALAHRMSGNQTNAGGVHLARQKMPVDGGPEPLHNVRLVWVPTGLNTAGEETGPPPDPAKDRNAKKPQIPADVELRLHAQTLHGGAPRAHPPPGLDQRDGQEFPPASAITAAQRPTMHTAGPAVDSSEGAGAGGAVEHARPSEHTQGHPLRDAEGDGMSVNAIPTTEAEDEENEEARNRSPEQLEPDLAPSKARKPSKKPDEKGPGWRKSKKKVGENPKSLGVDKKPEAMYSDVNALPHGGKRVSRSQTKPQRDETARIKREWREAHPSDSSNDGQNSQGAASDTGGEKKKGGSSDLATGRNKKRGRYQEEVEDIEEGKQVLVFSNSPLHLCDPLSYEC